MSTKVGEIFLGLTAKDELKAGIDKAAKNADKSMASIGKNLGKKLGKAMAVAAGAIAFKELVSAGLEAEGASARLAVTMANATGASWEQVQAVKSLTEQYQQLGVVSATAQQAGMQELSTYVSQVNSIEKMLPVLNDMVAQQYGYNATAEQAVTISTMLGKVLQGQTGALSRYGYYFDEAQEHLLKYGTEAERVATLAEVVSQSVGGMNEALGRTPSGAITQLKNNFGQLKEELGSLLINLLYPIVKVLNVIITKFIQFARIATSAIKAVFGIEDSAIISGINASGGAAVEAIEDQGEAIQKAKEKLGLASFDKLNTVGQNQQPSGASPVSGGGIDLGGITSGLDTTALLTDSIMSKMDLLKKKILDVFNSEPIQAFVNYAKTSFNFWVNHCMTLLKSLKERMSETWLNVKDDLQIGLNNMIYLWTEFWNTANATLQKWGPQYTEAVNKIFNTIWKDVIDPVAQGIATVWADATGILVELWDKHGAELLDAMGEFKVRTIELFQSIWDNVINPIIQPMLEMLSTLWEKHLKKLVKEIGDFIITLKKDALEIFNKFIQPVIKYLLEVLQPVWSSVWDTIMKIMGTVLGVISDIIGAILKIFRGLVDFITGVLTGNWEKAWDGIKTVFSGAWDGIVGILQGAWDMITNIFGGLANFFGSIFESAYRAISGPIDWMVDKIRGAFGWIGDLQGKISSVSNSVSNFVNSGISSIGSTISRFIPHFATGGYVDQPTLALVGEGGQGEYIMPRSDLASLLKQAASAAGGAPVGSGGNQPITINLTLDGQTITSTVIENINRRNRAAGTNVIKSY